MSVGNRGRVFFLDSDPCRLVTSEQGRIHDAVLRIMLEAHHSMSIASSTLKDFAIHERPLILLSDLVAGLDDKGVEIRILTTPRMLSSNFCSRLTQKRLRNVRVRTCGRNHMKLICVDEKFLYIGTANLTSSGLGIRSDRKRNFELGLITSRRDFIESALNLFNRTWTGLNCQSCAYSTISNINCSIPEIAHGHTRNARF